MPLDVIYEQLTDFGLNAGRDYKRVYRWYRAWKAYNILPFAGGYAEQPEDVLDDFDVFSLIEMEMTYPATTSSGGISTEALRGQAAD